MKFKQADGLWQFDHEEPFAHEGGRLVNDAFTFGLQGATVTLMLLTLHPGVWKSPDDCYRLAARWQGRMLQYRPPFGDWTDLAEFEEGRFVNIGNGKKRLFKRIEPDQVAAWTRAVLAPREPHDYRRQPDGSLGAKR